MSSPKPRKPADAPKAKRAPKVKLDAMHADSPLWAAVDERLKREVAARRPKPALRERAAQIAAILRREFPNATCALHHDGPFQLLVATILSAQCTDERVNMVTPALFRKYRGPAAFAAAPEGELETDIRSTGFFNSKAKAIRAMSQALLERHGGEVPRSIEEMSALRGAGRKTANVVRMHAFGLPGISVDTHFTRISNRLGLTKESDPEKIEFDVAALLPPEHWTQFADGVILHGRKTCHARKPKCEVCPLVDLCPSAFKAGEREGKR